MTLPKNITDAIDNFEGKAVDHWMHDHYGTDRATFDAKRQLVTDARAALETAIAAAIQQASDLAEQRISFAFGNANIDNPAVTKETVREAAAAIQPVEPPTDAEVEAWGNRMHDAMLTMDHSWDLPDAISCKPFGVHEQHAAVRRCITEAVALMRRARATGSWNGGPTVSALMRGVEDAAIEWGKCCGDYHAACQAAPPPSGLQATDAVREAGHRCELTYGYFQKAIKALADHGTQTGSLERLRERVQKTIDVTPRSALLGMLLTVRDWIDEERGAGR